LPTEHNFTATASTGVELMSGGENVDIFLGESMFENSDGRQLLLQTVPLGGVARVVR
jgi:hypothetical protein